MTVQALAAVSEGWMHDDLEDIFGDCGVEPRYDALVYLGPLDIAESHEGINGAIDMIKKT